MQSCFMPEKGTIYAVCILIRLQEEYHAKGKKLYMCFVVLEKAFDIVPGKILEWALKKKGIPEDLLTSTMSLDKRAMIRVRTDSDLSEV